MSEEISPSTKSDKHLDGYDRRCAVCDWAWHKYNENDNWDTAWWNHVARAYGMGGGRKQNFKAFKRGSDAHGIEKETIKADFERLNRIK